MNAFAFVNIIIARPLELRRYLQSMCVGNLVVEVSEENADSAALLQINRRPHKVTEQQVLPFVQIDVE